MIGSIRKALQIPVATRMTEDVVTISAGDTCNWALRLISTTKVRHLPVLDRGRLVGIVTETDIRRRAPQPILPENVNVAGVMTYAPVTVGPSTLVGEAIRLLLEHDVSGLPVVEDGRLLGLFTRSDVLRIFVEPGGAAPRAARKTTGPGEGLPSVAVLQMERPARAGSRRT